MLKLSEDCTKCTPSYCNDGAKKIVEMGLASTSEHSCACVNATNGHVIDSCGQGPEEVRNY